MTLKEFLKILDTIMPITLYVYADNIGTFDKEDIPGRYMSYKVEDVYIDEGDESIGIGLL